MRAENFNPDEFHLISNAGVAGQSIFLDQSDYARFTFLVTHLQSPIRIYNVSWYINTFTKKASFPVGDNKIKDILKERHVELVTFAILPGNFYLVVKNLGESLLSVYMHRILTGYSKYFNAKYKKQGHVFDGPFKASVVKEGRHLNEVSALIHKKPMALAEWQDQYEKYPWSGYQDFIGSNRWGALLSIEPILKYFKKQSDYVDFVESFKEKLT